MSRSTKKPREIIVGLHGKTVGTLTDEPAGPVFRYSDEWRGSAGFELSPLHWPRSVRVFPPNPKEVMHGIPGFLADSIADSFGMKLISRYLDKERAGLTPDAFDCLALVGDRGMGALTYSPSEPWHDEHEDSALGAASLGRLAKHADNVIRGIGDGVLSRTLFDSANSIGGARPKMRVAIDDKGMIHSFHKHPPGCRHFILKFENPDELDNAWGRIELAYRNMAEAAGIDIPHARIVTGTLDGPAGTTLTLRNFAVERFDIRPDGKRLHLHTFAGYMNRSIRAKDGEFGDYEDMVDTIGALAPGDADSLARLFRRCVFNVLSGNRDDHFKNFSMLHDGVGWSLSPCYDLCHMDGTLPWLRATGGRCSRVNGKGSGIRHADFMRLADSCQLRTAEAKNIIAEVRNAVADWPKHAAEAEVPEPRIKFIGADLNALIKETAARTTGRTL